jgi:hypothetical protein
MTDYNKPQKHRLDRLRTRVEKALDELSRGAGEMRPAVFREIREPLEITMRALEQLSAKVEAILAAQPAQAELPVNEQQALERGQSPYADDETDETEITEGEKKRA